MPKGLGLETRANSQRNYRVSKHHINRIANGHSWKYLDADTEARDV